MRSFRGLTGLEPKELKMEKEITLGSAHRPEPFWTVQALVDIGVPVDEIRVQRNADDCAPWVNVPLSRLGQIIERAPELAARASNHQASMYCVDRIWQRFWIPAYGKPGFECDARGAD